MDIKDVVPGGKERQTQMRDILHKTHDILGGRGKTIRIHEHGEDKECITHVRKNFIYITQEAVSQEDIPAPQVHINKSFDSVSRDEKFSFRVKGFFYVNRNRRLVKVGYCHTLNIRLHWKVKVTSPKKSVTMA